MRVCLKKRQQRQQPCKLLTDSVLRCCLGLFCEGNRGNSLVRFSVLRIGVLGGFEGLDGEVDQVLPGVGMEDAEAAGEDGPVLGGALVVGVVGTGFANGLAQAEDGGEAGLGGADGWVALEADDAFELLEGGDVAVGLRSTPPGGHQRRCC